MQIVSRGASIAVSLILIAALAAAPALAAEMALGSKNFTAPAAVPNYFANESGPVLGGRADSRVVDPPNVAKVVPPPTPSRRATIASAPSYQPIPGPRYREVTPVATAKSHATKVHPARGKAHFAKTRSVKRHLVKTHTAKAHLVKTRAVKTRLAKAHPTKAHLIKPHRLKTHAIKARTRVHYAASRAGGRHTVAKRAKVAAHAASTPAAHAPSRRASKQSAHRDG